MVLVKGVLQMHCHEVCLQELGDAEASRYVDLQALGDEPLDIFSEGAPGIFTEAELA